LPRRKAPVRSRFFPSSAFPTIDRRDVSRAARPRVRAHFLDQLGNMRKPRSHICGQGFHFRVHDLVQGFDGPLHIQYTTKEIITVSFNESAGPTLLGPNPVISTIADDTGATRLWMTA
jgi:hypothetical protein